MASINVVLRTDKKPDKNGEYAIAIRVYHKRYMYHYLGIKVAPEHWNDRSGTVRASHSKHAVFNDIIDREYERIDNGIIRIEQEYSDPTPQRIKAMLKSGGKDESIDIIEYCKGWIENLEAEGQHGYAQVVNSNVNKLIKFNGKYLPFEEMTVSFLKRFERWMSQVLDNRQTTIYNTLSTFKNAYRQAIKDGIAKQESNPFFIYDMSKGKAQKKTHLNFKEIKAITRLELPEGSDDAITRDGFLFSFWCAGIRIGDLCTLDWVEHIKGWGTEQPTLEYEMRKNGKLRVFPLLPPAIEILEKYEPEVKRIGKPNLIFPFIKSDQVVQSESKLYEAIKRVTADNIRNFEHIASKAGIRKHITNHTSRHSFAGCFEELGLPVESLQRLLAHSDLQTTEVYRRKLGVGETKKNRKSLNEFYDRYKEVENG